MRTSPQPIRTLAFRCISGLLIAAVLGSLPAASADPTDTAVRPPAIHPVDRLDDAVAIQDPGVVVVGEPFPHERCRWTGPNSQKCQTGICLLGTPQGEIGCYWFEQHDFCPVPGECVGFKGQSAEAADWVFGELVWCLPESLPGCW